MSTPEVDNELINRRLREALPLMDKALLTGVALERIKIARMIAGDIGIDSGRVLTYWNQHSCADIIDRALTTDNRIT